jgi:hypothetical protein
MSLYNALFGTNNAAPILLAILNKSSTDFGRFRDAYLNEDDSKIIVYTRCGGGNRDDYESVFEEMKSHPNFISDYDDDFDCTYAYFEFSIPDEYKEQLKLVAEKIGQKESPTEKFQSLINNLQSDKDTPETERAMEVGKKIFGEIKDALDSGENKTIEI